jgi:ribonuclease T2
VRKALGVLTVVGLAAVDGVVGGSAASAIEAVLAASWEPTFCQSSAGREKKECRTLTADRRAATHLSLHGLWPDDLDDEAIFPCYCAGGAPISCDARGPTDRNLRLSSPLFGRLREVMPGAISGLHRHEWSKHGTCFADAGQTADPEEYFDDAIALIEKLDASPVGQLFRDNLGSVITRTQIEAAFDQAFGKGASARVTIACSGRGKNAMIAELRVNISGDVAPDADLSALILAAPDTTASTDDRSCAKGRVEQVMEN